MRRPRARLVTSHSGGLGAPVRSHYEGLPSMAGRGGDEGGPKPAGSGRPERPPSPPGSTGPGTEIAAVERRRARRLVSDEAPPPATAAVDAPSGAPPPRAFGATRGRPANSGAARRAETITRTRSAGMKQANARTDARASADADDDPPPEDMDACRLELARRIYRFVADRSYRWRTCPERACKRARACMTREGRCRNLEPPKRPASERDIARAQTWLRRALEQRLEQEEAEQDAAAHEREANRPESLRRSFSPPQRSRRARSQRSSA